MSGIHEALGELLAVRRLRVQVTPAIGYDVTAPCRLRQLADAVGSSLGTGHGGGNSDGSPALADPAALDLWGDILHATSAWAVAVGVDRRTYLRPAVRPSGAPGVLRYRGAGYDAATDEQGPPRAVVVMTPDTPLWAAETTPPLGRLLRASAAEADRLGYDAMCDTIARDARRWAGRIDAMLGAVRDRIRARDIAGVRCPDCGARVVVADVDGERTQLPAVLVGLSDDESPYWACRSCLAAGWLVTPEELAAVA
jgi:hypothetical protein